MDLQLVVALLIIFATLIYYFLFYEPKIPAPKLKMNQSVAVRREREKGETPVYRNALTKDELLEHFNGMKTINELWE